MGKYIPLSIRNNMNPSSHCRLSLNDSVHLISSYSCGTKYGIPWWNDLSGTRHAVDRGTV